MSTLGSLLAALTTAPCPRMGLILGLIPFAEYLFLIPICVAIAIVNAASHREEMRSILRHALRSSVMLTAGIVLFKFAISFFFEWVLPR